MRHSRLIRVICYVAFFLLLFSPQRLSAEQAVNWHRGPLTLSDQFPLGLYHQSFLPRSPETLNSQEIQLRSAFAWTNTHNRIAGTLNVDSEVRTVDLSARYGHSERLEVGVALPVVWQGGGVLDSFIENWHRAFGLPQGPRDDAGVQNNSLVLDVRNDQAELSSLASEGLALGDVSISSTYQLSAGDQQLPALAASVSLRLPSGSSRYGGDSLDLNLGIHASKGFGEIYLYSGLAYGYYEDTTRENLVFESHRAYGYLYLEWAVTRRISLVLGGSIASDLIQNLSRFPEYQSYLDMGGFIELSPQTELEILVRENPTPDTATADYSMMLALRHRFSLL